MKVDGAAVRQLREAAGLSLTELARRAGITKGYLSLIEHGKRNPRPAVVTRLAAALAFDRPVPELVDNREK